MEGRSLSNPFYNHTGRGENTFLLVHLSVYYLFTVSAQDIVISIPGQDVELMCDVGTGPTVLWRINESSSVHTLNDLFNGAVAGHGVRGSNIVIQNIMMNDVRNGSQYRCEVSQLPPDPNIIGNVTIMYVAGEYKDIMCVHA